jgi:hypothetical protein
VKRSLQHALSIALANEKKEVKKYWNGKKKQCGVCSHSLMAGTIAGMLAPDLHLQRHIKLSLALCLTESEANLIHI